MSPLRECCHRMLSHLPVQLNTPVYITCNILYHTPRRRKAFLIFLKYSIKNETLFSTFYKSFVFFSDTIFSDRISGSQVTVFLLLNKRLNPNYHQNAVTPTERAGNLIFFIFYIKNKLLWRTIPFFIENKGLIRN
jgi:hypothetical protein